MAKKKQKPGIGHNSDTSQRLKSIIERIERVEAEIADLSGDKSEIYSEAKQAGFDCRIIRAIIRERKMTNEERHEYEALLDVYKASLGMLDGTPLGKSAIDRLSKKPPKDGDEPDAGAEDAAEEAPKPLSEKEISASRELGKKAASKGESVTSNPYPALDPRRAAWDEGWCSSAGSDGMEIPPAWRRTKKSPDEKEEK